MAETIKVEAVPERGVMGNPRGGPGDFIGLRRWPGSSEPKGEVVYQVPGGSKYTHAGVVEVPSTREIRRALRDPHGPLRRADEKRSSGGGDSYEPTETVKRGGGKK